MPPAEAAPKQHADAAFGLRGGPRIQDRGRRVQTCVPEGIAKAKTVEAGMQWSSGLPPA